MQIHRDDSWLITLSKKDKCIIIKTTDYHAEPLKLTRKELYTLGKLLNKRVKRVS